MVRISNNKSCKDLIQSKFDCCDIWIELDNTSNFKSVRTITKDLFNSNKFFNDFLKSTSKTYLIEDCRIEDVSSYLEDVRNTINSYFTYANKRIKSFLKKHNYSNEDVFLGLNRNL